MFNALELPCWVSAWDLLKTIALLLSCALAHASGNVLRLGGRFWATKRGEKEIELWPLEGSIIFFVTCLYVGCMLVVNDR